MPKVKINTDLCIGCGLCTSTCPDCFELGPDGKSQYKNPAETACDLKEVAADCPVGAIEVEE